MFLGLTRPELGGSEVAAELGFSNPEVPQVDLVSAKARYEAVFKASQQGLITACHDCSDGGLGVALAEMCIGGRLGAKVELDSVPVCGNMNVTGVLYSESASRLVVSVNPADREAFEALFAGQVIGQVGKVSDTPKLIIEYADKIVSDEEVAALADAFKATLDW